jgi:hypothetical protein
VCASPTCGSSSRRSAVSPVNSAVKTSRRRAHINRVAAPAQIRHRSSMRTFGATRRSDIGLKGREPVYAVGDLVGPSFHALLLRRRLVSKHSALLLGRTTQRAARRFQEGMFRYRTWELSSQVTASRHPALASLDGDERRRTAIATLRVPRQRRRPVSIWRPQMHAMWDENTYGTIGQFVPHGAFLRRHSPR